MSFLDKLCTWTALCLQTNFFPKSSESNDKSFKSLMTKEEEEKKRNAIREMYCSSTKRCCKALVSFDASGWPVSDLHLINFPIRQYNSVKSLRKHKHIFDTFNLCLYKVLFPLFRMNKRCVPKIEQCKHC